MRTISAVVALLVLLGCGAERGVVVLVPGAGTDARVYAPLARSLVREGYEVRALDDHRDLPRRLTEAARPGLPLYAVGLDLGGTALYRAAPDVPALSGVVGVGAPVAFGGASRALRAAIAERPRSWSALPERLGRVLVGVQPAAAPLDLSRWAGLDGGRPVPVPVALDALARRPDLPVLVVMSPTDALAPPWACDPAAFGVRRRNIERVRVTRGNGFSREYRHLELLLHRAAPGEVFPIIEGWLAAR